MSCLPRRDKLDPKQAAAIDFAVAQDGNFSVSGEAGTGKSVVSAHGRTPKTFRAHFPACRQFAILVSAMLRQSFTDFIFATNTDGSGRAASYVRALDMLGPILTKHCPVKAVNGTMRYF